MKIQPRETLQRIFLRPAPSDVPWFEMELMLRQLGVTVATRSDSRIALVKDGEAMVVYRPQPEPLAQQATVKDIAAFLRTLGLEP